jgi:hypothetical protein
MGDDGAHQRARQGAENRQFPLTRVEQLAPVEGEAGGGRAEGRAEFVGAQYQVGRHTGGEQGRGGEQATAAGNGVDKTGNKGNGTARMARVVKSTLSSKGMEATYFRRGAEGAALKSDSLPITECYGDCCTRSIPRHGVALPTVIQQIARPGNMADRSVGTQTPQPRGFANPGTFAALPLYIPCVRGAER